MCVCVQENCCNILEHLESNNSSAPAEGLFIAPFRQGVIAGNLHEQDAR